MMCVRVVYGVGREKLDMAFLSGGLNCCFILTQVVSGGTGLIGKSCVLSSSAMCEEGLVFKGFRERGELPSATQVIMKLRTASSRVGFSACSRNTVVTWQKSCPLY